jgi:hypothetical protein
MFLDTVWTNMLLQTKCPFLKENTPLEKFVHIPMNSTLRPEMNNVYHMEFKEYKCGPFLHYCT